MARTPRRGDKPPAPLQLCKREQAPPTVAAPPAAPAPLVITPKPAANPGAEIQRARAIAAGLAPRSVERLAELVECGDGKVALVACEAVRKWTEEPKTGGGVSDKQNLPVVAEITQHQERCARAMAIREGLYAAMPGASELELWTAIAARLHGAGYDLTNAFAIEEIECVVMSDEVRAIYVKNGKIPPFDKLPLPLRDEAVRRRLDPRCAAEPERPSKEALDELMKDLGPQKPLN